MSVPFPGWASVLCYLTPPENSPRALISTGFYIYLFLSTHRLQKEAGIALGTILYQTFSFLVLASWMRLGSHQRRYKSEAQNGYINFPRVVKDPKTYEHISLYEMLECLWKPEPEIASSWIHSHISVYITQSTFNADVRELLSAVPLHNLAYAAETLLSYKLTYRDGLPSFDKSLSVSGELRAVEDTPQNRVELMQLFPINDYRARKR